MAQHALHVQTHLAVLGGLRQQSAVKIAVDQTGKVIDLGFHLRQLLKPEGVAHAHRGAGPLFLVGGEVLVADGASGLGRSPVGSLRNRVILILRRSLPLNSLFLLF